MSGRRINDYGGMPNTSDKLMASKNHVKHFSSAEGAGHVGTSYPDTDPDIRRDQEDGIRKAESHRMKSGYRN